MREWEKEKHAIDIVVVSLAVKKILRTSVKNIHLQNQISRSSFLLFSNPSQSQYISRGGHNRAI